MHVGDAGKGCTDSAETCWVVVVVVMKLRFEVEMFVGFAMEEQQ
jgi:hypothetical protein